MRRNGWITLCASLLLALTVLVGCGLPVPTDSNSADDGDVQKNLYIAKQDVDGNVLFTIADQVQVDAFFDAYLDAGVNAEAENGPSLDSAAGLTPEWEYVVTQDKTILAGQTEPDGTEEILRYTLYENSNVVTIQIAPEAVAQASMPRWLSAVLRFSYEEDAGVVAYLKACTEEDVTNGV